MGIKTFFQILRRNFLLILAGGALCASAAWWLVSKQKQEFNSEAVVSTGIISSVNIKNTGAGKSVDRDYAQNELENLISLATAHQTRTSLATNLLARYLYMPQADPKWISPEEFDFLQKEVFNDALKALRDTSIEATLQKLITKRDAVSKNVVQDIIFSDEVYFGIEYLQKNLKVFRRGNSDILQFTYHTTDRQICQQTLNEMLDLFLLKHATLKKNQSSEVAAYFENATNESASKLKKTEASLLAFRIQNNIINYGEQTRTIAIKKEDLDDLKFKENMALEGTRASRQVVESELGNKNELSEINQGMLSMRKELSQISIQLDKMDIAGQATDETLDATYRLKLENRRAELKEGMHQFVSDSYNFKQSPSGMQKQKLLDKWLNTIVDEEQSQAKLDVIDLRQSEFAIIYSKYAPWGSKLTELQRAINLAENEYLENLHSYNQSLLNKQHTLMASKLELIDAPYLPLIQADYKKFLFLILGFAGGSFMVFASLIALAFMDETLQTPEDIENKTGLEVATVLPNFLQSQNNKVKKELARQQALSLLLQQIKVETLQKDHQPKLILVSSTRQQEGKSWICEQIAPFLRAESNRILYLFPIEGGVLPSTGIKDNVGYELSSQMLNAERIQDLDIFGDAGLYLEAFNYVIMEIPALLTGKYPLSMLRQFDLCLLVCQANRNWEAADEQALKTLQRASRCPIRSILNGVQMDTVEAFMGELSLTETMPTIHPSKKEATFHDK